MIRNVWDKWSNDSFNILYIKEKEVLSVYVSKDNSTYEKQKNHFNDSKLRNRRMVLSCSEKIICIITWNNFQI